MKLKGPEMKSQIKIALLVIIYGWSAYLTYANEGYNRDLKNDTASVKILIGAFKSTNKKLEIRYQIQNRSNHDVWICDGIDINRSSYCEEVYMDDDQTLHVRRRLNVPMEGYGQLSFGKYVRLRRGENRTESLSFNLPIHYRRFLSGVRPLGQLEYASILAIEVGYYTIDLPRIVSDIIEEAKKINNFDNEGMVSFPNLDIELDIATLDLLRMSSWDPNDKNAPVIIPYTFQKFKGEYVSQAIFDGLKIPYQELPQLKEDSITIADLTPLENLHDLFYEGLIEAEQYRDAEALFSCPEQQYDEIARKLADIYNRIGKGEAPANNLERLLDTVAEKYDRDRVIEELLEKKEEKERQLLDIAKANDNKIQGRQALLALDQLLTLNPSHEYAFELRRKISAYYSGDIHTNSIGMELVWIPPGDFLMGAPPGQGGLRRERPKHEVRISKDFWMGVYEVSQAQFEIVMGKNPSFFKGDNLPVEMVSYNDAMEFCHKLSQREGKAYRLPTEAEWEYACRAGTTTPFSWNYKWQVDLCNSENEIDSEKNRNIDVFKNRGLPLNSTTPIGTFKANFFGLYDMHGNVREWCQDWYASDYYLKGQRIDPKGPDKGRYYVVRGGGWRSGAFFCRSSYRDFNNPSTAENDLGFRVVCTSISK